MSETGLSLDPLLILSVGARCVGWTTVGMLVALAVIWIGAWWLSRDTPEKGEE